MHSCRIFHSGVRYPQHCSTQLLLFPVFHCSRGACRQQRSHKHQSSGESHGHYKPLTQENVGNQITKIRNIGIMAHIDAGKTTTTERMLYYAGITRALGDVDRGDTVMDFLRQERDRGITINSAAISFTWNNHRINLIDTPGHVDFTVEVERSLRVLDGAVAILDASSGVEAQTLTVWRQADNYKLPRIVYLNKMDKKDASLELCLNSLQKKLNAKPLLMHLPLGVGKSFHGFVDLTSMEVVSWSQSGLSNDGREFSRQNLDGKEDKELYEQALKARGDLIEQLADCVDGLAELIVSTGNYDVIAIPKTVVRSALRKACLNQDGVPVVCGSSLKNTGVQTLLDAVIHYLPAPSERHNDVVAFYRGQLCAYAFKVQHDKQRGGTLVYFRVYSGQMNSKQELYNVNKKSEERLSRLYLAYADELEQIPSVSAGNIAVAVGLKKTTTGDTLVTPPFVVSASKKTHKKIVSGKKSAPTQSSIVLPALESLTVPEPVFFCTIEAGSASQEKELEYALECLQREDPSLHVDIDSDTGETVLSGMGELHLDIIRDRIEKQFKIDVDIGPLNVSYKETILIPSSATQSIDKVLGDKRQTADISLEISPSPKGGPVHSVQFHRSLTVNRQFQYAIENGIIERCSQGNLLGYPVYNIDVKVVDVNISPDTAPAIIAACAAGCVQKVLEQSQCALLQPMMSLEVTTDEDCLHSVLGDLAHRHSRIKQVEDRVDTKVVVADVPLAQMLGYATVLRTITSGTGTFSLHFSHYDQLTNQEQQRVIAKISGLIV